MPRPERLLAPAVRFTPRPHRVEGTPRNPTRRRKAVIPAAAALLFACLWASPALAEFHPDDVSDRNWDYSARYFFDAFSFRAPLRWDAEWERAENGYRIELGSVVTDEFYILQHAKLTQHPADWLSVRFRYRQTEDFDARTQRHAVGVGFQALPRLRIEPFTELDPFKEWIDLGLRLHGLAPGLGEGNLSFTIVDAVYNRKAKQGIYRKRPYSLSHDSVFFIVPDRVWMGLDVSVDFPLVLELPDDGLLFRFRRTRASLLTVAELSPGLELRLEAGAEWTRKHRNYDLFSASGPDARTVSFDRQAGWGRIEGARVSKKPDGFEEVYTAGLRWMQLFERWRYAHAQTEDRILWKRDFVLYGSARRLLSDPLYIKTALFAGRVEHDDHFVNHNADDYHRFHPACLRLGLYLGLWFGPGLDITPFFYLDGYSTKLTTGGYGFRFEFGGGGVNAVLAF